MVSVQVLYQKKRRSNVWNTFRKIYEIETNQVVANFYACFICGKVLKQHGTGTSNFNDHKCVKNTRGEKVIPDIIDRKALCSCNNLGCSRRNSIFKDRK